MAEGGKWGRSNGPVALKDDRSQSRIQSGMEALEIQPERRSPELELALLRRGMHERDARRQACQRCSRTPLVGERIYRGESGSVLCELCRAREAADPPGRWSLVQGPEFGHTVKLLDSSAA